MTAPKPCIRCRERTRRRIRIPIKGAELPRLVVCSRCNAEVVADLRDALIRAAGKALLDQADPPAVVLNLETLEVEGAPQ